MGEIDMRDYSMCNRVKAVFVSGVILALPVHAKADSPKFDQVTCMRHAAEIVEQTGAQFDRLSPSGANIFLRHPSLKTLTLNCERSLFNLAAVKSIPDRDFYDVLDRVGSIMFGARPGQARALAQRCHKMALANNDLLMGEVVGSLLSVDCNVVLRGEGGFFVGMSARQN